MVETRNAPLITTIIPTFKRPDRLKKAIQSVLNQTYPHFQICIYDNASTDTTAEVVAEFMREDSRVQYHCHKSNIGAGENFQYGLSRVNTPFFSFLSDDDFLLPNFYETVMDGFDKHPEAAFSMGAVIDMTDKKEIVDVVLSKWPEKEYYLPPEGLLEMIGKYSNWIGTLFRKEIIDKIGSLDLTLKAIDVDFMFRAAAQFPFAITKKPCAVFVQHASSYSGQNGLKLIWPGWQTMIAKLKENDHLPLEAKLIAERKLQIELRNLLLMNVMRSLEKKNFEDAKAIMEIFNQEIDQKRLKQLLSTMIKICQYLPVMQTSLAFLLKVRRFWLRCIKKLHLYLETRSRF